ncbi:MAG: Crp/Fnr family transcriptional regulator [Sporocytophaga sp.]|uniref:Crp/Fnr family transcriptional regulator n=1 Tax=Sporocytophaga sp. TaxID=2231183 RepID=UPI001B0D2FB3|nr:Crp/Fnr family transcriptional regulator [Sporocytophaga sp.]MBO9701452.1 Crp/Fnr family transcriptional regulator [Sporocytophaga sp.]
MENLIEFLEQVELLSEESKEILRSFLYIEKLKKGSFFLELGAICNKIGFVKSGIIRVQFFNESGEEFTRYFINEKHFAVDLTSFNDRSPSKEYLQALTDMELVIITREAMEYFSTAISNWDSIIRKLTEKALLEKLKLSNEMVLDDAYTRYHKLMERQPGIVQRIPLNIIASYLGVSQYTLSRIRNRYR